MAADTRTITVEQLAAAGFEPDQFVCARCHHHGSRHDVNDRCLDCIEQVGPDYFVSMTVDEAWDWGLLRLFAALPSTHEHNGKPCSCGAGGALFPSNRTVSNAIPEDEADRLLVALVDPQDEQLDTEGFCEHGLLSGVGCSEWEHKPWDAARAYIERKGLA